MRLYRDAMSAEADESSKSYRRFKALAMASAGVAALMLGGMTAASAQDETEEDAPAVRDVGPAAAPESTDRIVVTGSRIQRTDFNTIQPTTVIDASDLEDMGVVNLGDAAADLPQNVSTFTPAQTGNSAFFAGSNIVNLRGLNPFFGTRTLTLIDSRRHVPTNQGDSVDLNFIPTILVERFETVTGGASAQYGSGAIAGVQNVILAREMEGSRITADFAISEQGDGEDTHLAGAYGTELFDGRLNFVVGAEYQDAAAARCIDREFCARGVGTVTNGSFFAPDQTQSWNYTQALRTQFNPSPAPPYIPFPGLPYTNLVEGLRANQMSTTGVFINSGFQVNEAGTGVVPWDYGPMGEVYAEGVAGFAGARGHPFNVIGGDGEHIYEFTNLRSPVERFTASGLLKYELTSSIDAIFEINGGKVESTNINNGATTRDEIAFSYGSIAVDNAYLAQSPELLNAALLSPVMVPNAGGPFGNPLIAPGVGYLPFAKNWREQVGNSTQTADTEVWRIAAGLEGKLEDFGDGSWLWDAYVQVGETTRQQLVDNLAANIRYKLALDAVVDPVTQEIVCRVSLPGNFLPYQVANGFAPEVYELAQGCVPLNPFGIQPLADEQLHYAFGYLREDLTYSQAVVGANIGGDVWEGWGAGPIQLAAGVEARHEAVDNISAPELNELERADFQIQYGESFAGDVNVYEAYTEVNVPIVANLPALERVEINGSIRASRYENERPH